MCIKKRQKARITAFVEKQLVLKCAVQLVVCCPHSVLSVVVQLLLFLKAFSESEQTKLAMLTGILLANSTLPPPIITSLFTDSVVKEGEMIRHCLVIKEKLLLEQMLGIITSQHWINRVVSTVYRQKSKCALQSQIVTGAII